MFYSITYQAFKKKLVYLNEENLPLKRVRFNPAYNTFVRLVFFLVWFLYKTRTADRGLGIKHGLGIKRGFRKEKLRERDSGLA